MHNVRFNLLSFLGVFSLMVFCPASGVSAAKSAAAVPSLKTLNVKAPAAAPLTEDERVNVNVYKSASRSVAYITTSSVALDAFYQPVPTEGAGSGCVLTSDGYILTNNHVIKGAQGIKVTLWDGTTLPAQVTGTDPEYDTAVIKIDPGAKVLSPIALGDSSKLEVVRRVFAIGSPFGLDHTMTTGIISNTSRTLTSQAGRVVRGIIQTDAAINPGNSGGPLLNTRGEMIGLTTAIYSKLGSANAQWGGIGFAIPINVVKDIFPQLIAYHHVVRPDMGIKVRPVPGGLMVLTVEPDGPAGKAGVSGLKVRIIHQGPLTIQNVDADSADIILKIDNTSVASIDDLLANVESKKPGQVVTLTINRQGKTLRIPVKLTSSSPADE